MLSIGRKPKIDKPALQVKPTLSVKPSLSVKPALIPTVKPEVKSTAVVEADEVLQGEVQSTLPDIDLGNMTGLELSLSMLQSALEATPMGDVKGHMLVLQKELQQTEYLVDMLEPEDIGLLMRAQRSLMETDILVATTPKKRKAAPKKPVVSAEALAAVDADDFAF